MLAESVQVSLRNSALPPTPSESAIGPPGAVSPSAAAGAAFLTGFLAAASSSDSAAGGGVLAGFSSPSSGSAAALDGVFSSELASSLSGAASAPDDFDLLLADGVLCFLAGFFFFASADSDVSRTNSATKNASARHAVGVRRRSPGPGWIRNRDTHTADPPRIDRKLIAIDRKRYPETPLRAALTTLPPADEMK